MEDEDMKRWARRNLPTVVFLTALLLLAALAIPVIELGKPQTVSKTPSSTSAVQPIKQAERFDEAAYQSRLLDEAYAPVEHETADIPSTYELPEPPQEADSKPCGKGGFECQDKGDWERLAIAIYQEAGGDACCDECRYRVGDIILNRVADERFPDSIEAVLTQPKQYGTLSTTGVVGPTRASEPGEAHAVERAWRVAEEILTGTHSDVYGEGYVFQAEFPQGNDPDSRIYCEQCGMWYCK